MYSRCHCRRRNCWCGVSTTHWFRLGRHFCWFYRRVLAIDPRCSSRWYRFRHPSIAGCDWFGHVAVRIDRSWNWYTDYVCRHIWILRWSLGNYRRDVRPCHLFSPLSIKGDRRPFLSRICSNYFVDIDCKLFDIYVSRVGMLPVIRQRCSASSRTTGEAAYHPWSCSICVGTSKCASAGP